MKSINKRFIQEAKYQKKINEKITQCLTCERKCKISEGRFGHCQTRYNDKGRIYTIVYGCNATISNNPIEKKPLYHFFPGSKALTIGCFGCNFDCFWCQNHNTSHPNGNILDIMKIYDKFLSPKQFIERALKENSQGISISFNEPTLLFEYSLKVFELAKQNGLYNTYVTNGYMTKNVLNDLVESGLDAMNIDIKGDNDMVEQYCGADVEKVWRNAKLAKDLGVHIEITTLLIENLNSSKEIVRKISDRIVKELGEYTPYHISRFFPQFKSVDHGKNTATKLRSLYQAFEIVKATGLKYVYVGNITNKKYLQTICPKCSEVVIRRNNYFGVEEKHIDKNGKCNSCSFQISIV
jgi:pyruvate formate lyase activating enzyme